MNLKTPLAKALKTRKQYIEALESMGLYTIEDFLLYLPRSYDDLSGMQTIISAPVDQKATIRGTVTKIAQRRSKKGMTIVTANFTDGDGTTVEAIWFNQPHIKRMLSDEQEVVFTGYLKETGRKLQFSNPQVEVTSDALHAPVHGGRLVPIYPQHEVITSKWLREKMVLVKAAIKDLPETLPAQALKSEKLLSRVETIQALHFPEDTEILEKARQRMAFEEMYLIQKEALERKQAWQGKATKRLQIPMDTQLIKDFFASLKFTPTGSQKIAIYEILKDMESGKAMSRLLEGDVGSGKTLVATAVMANVIKHGGQCALMVPTEVLAKQHTQSIGTALIRFQKYLAALSAEQQGVGFVDLPRVALLTGSVPKNQGDEIKRKLGAGEIDLIIGTHALIEDSVEFKDLKLVIVDEQHRFGVAQRKRLQDKGNPHFLTMTATPIPRTLALTGFGHHDLSVLLEKPGNRKPIETKVVSPKDRKTVELFINNQIDEGRQAFVICPLIRESDKEGMTEIKNVEQEAERLKASFASRRIALLHGKMTTAEKESIMQAFKNGEYDILVSTSVIEVGIDIPNSTIIVIEGAERFGLSQLHQFRGRVGRSDHKSYCFLFTTTVEQARSIRLKAMEQHDSGFLLAEIDLKIRGPGELYGFRQSGLPDIKFGGLLNPELVVKARQVAERVLKLKN